jgi:hypothetical protein
MALSFLARSIVFLCLLTAVTRRDIFFSLMAKAIEPPISPGPIIATSLNKRIKIPLYH